MSKDNKDSDSQAEKMRLLIRKSTHKLPGSVRFRLLNAFDGIEKAENLLEIDREIASFRGMTAQEEAACAVFNALKIKKYPRADELNLYSHPHKAAFWFIVDTLHHSLGRGMAALRLNFTLDATKPEIIIALPADQFGVNLPETPDLQIQLVEPFHMLRSKGGLPDTFDAEMTEILSARGVKKVDKYVRELANQRNKILYATDQALPFSQANLNEVHSRRGRIYLAAVLCIGILQTDTIQHFMNQGLRALLKAVGKEDAEKCPSCGRPQRKT